MSKQKTTIAEPLPVGELEENSFLLSDERWQAVQRLIQTAGLQRAGQLRNILLYITRSAILHPDVPLREYEIARQVLGRRADFDPISDNIVRAQMSHLRRRLENFYLEEGRDETLCITIPKGSYVPVFKHVDRPVHATPAPEPEAVERDLAAVVHPVQVEPAPLSSWSKLQILLAAGCVLLAVSTAVLSWKVARTDPSRHPAALSGNAFVAFLSKSPGNVVLILPDTSLSLMQQIFQTDISAEDYASNKYLQKEMGSVADSQFSEALAQLRKKRYTSMGEAAIAFEFQRVLTVAGIPTSLRFARDLHSRDLNEGNTILVGSRKSNPWASLFNQRMNFVFLQDPVDRTDYFEDLHPQGGEQPRYVPYQHHDGKVSSYIDVALTSNLTSSGYVLLFNGSDSQSVEAASHFLLYGKLPQVIDSMLRRDDLTYFEIFLRGTHAEFESEETFEVVGVRSGSGK